MKFMPFSADRKSSRQFTNLAVRITQETTVLSSKSSSIARFRQKIPLGEKSRPILEAASMMVEALAAEFSILAAQIKIDILMLNPRAGTRH